VFCGIQQRSALTRKFLKPGISPPEDSKSHLAERRRYTVQTVRLSKKTLDELLQHSVWLQQELQEKQDRATNEDDAVWLANRIYEIEKIKEQARLEAMESL
jgi:hypothetical protein